MSLQTEMRQDTLMYFNSFICIASYDRVICGFDFEMRGCSMLLPLWKKCCVVLILDFTQRKLNFHPILPYCYIKKIMLLSHENRDGIMVKALPSC